MVVSQRVLFRVFQNAKCVQVGAAHAAVALLRAFDGKRLSMIDADAKESISSLRLWDDQNLNNVELPKGLQSLSFGKYFNQSLENVTLPGSLQSLTFGEEFDESLGNVALPASLQSLTFGEEFNQSLENVSLPANLQSLTFGRFFGQSLQNVALPDSLQSLTFGEVFNQSLENVALPANLQSLTFGEEFNQSLENVALPASLRSLTFGFRFNQSLENVALPGSLQCLSFGVMFNQSLENVAFPGSLRSLTCGFQFNQSLENVALPGSLQSLIFGSRFNQSLDHVALPANLQSLTLGYGFNQNLENVALPGSLRSLTLEFHFKQSLACAKEEAARKLAELQPLILRAIDIQTHLVATLISRKDDTGIDCELETPSFYVSGGAKRVSITCSCQPRTRCRVKQPVVCRGDCINVFAGRVEALFCRSVEQGGVPERTLLCKLGVVHPTLNRAMTSPVLASAALPLLDILPIKVGGVAVHQEVLAQMSAFVSDGKWSWGSRHTVGRCCWVLLLVDFVASFGLHRSFIHSRLPIGKAVRRFRDLMLHILALHGCKAEAVTGLSTLKTVGLGHTSGLTCLRRFSHPNAIWCFVLRLGNKVVPKPSHKKSIASLIPDWSFLSVGLPSL